MPYLLYILVAVVIGSMPTPVSLAQDPDVSPFGDDVDWGHPQTSEPSIGLGQALPILVTFEAPIKPGQQDAVRELVSRMVAFNQQGEPGTVLYRVFMREDRQVLTFVEGYAQSDAMLFHDKRFITHFADDIAALTVGGRLCIYGDVSDAYKTFAAENGLEVEYFTSLSGFQR
jgi:quinol monooxygenase YgiN